MTYSLLDVFIYFTIFSKLNRFIDYKNIQNIMNTRRRKQIEQGQKSIDSFLPSKKQEQVNWRKSDSITQPFRQLPNPDNDYDQQETQKRKSNLLKKYGLNISAEQVELRNEQRSYRAPDMCQEKQWLIPSKNYQNQKINYSSDEILDKSLIQKRNEKSKIQKMAQKQSQFDKQEFKKNVTPQTRQTKRSSPRNFDKYSSSISLNIQSNQKVEKILNSQPLRLKHAHLLDKSHQYSIDYQHKILINILKYIDNTIEGYYNRGKKRIFFKTIQENLRDNFFTRVELENIQQLIFLDPRLFILDWELNEDKVYDLLFKLPNKIQSQEQRCKELRNKIINHLIIKQEEMIIKEKLTKTGNPGWHPKFKVAKEMIPLAELPLNAAKKNAEIKQMSNEQINAVKNPVLKQLLSQRKNKSLKQDNIFDRFFSKQRDSFKRQLIENVRRKDEQLKMQAYAQKQLQEKICKNTLITICENIIQIICGKNKGSNIFKANLINALDKRMKQKVADIIKHFDFLLELEIKFLKKTIVPSSKMQVIIVDRTLIKPVKEYIKENF